MINCVAVSDLIGNRPRIELLCRFFKLYDTAQLSIP